MGKLFQDFKLVALWPMYTRENIDIVHLLQIYLILNKNCWIWLSFFMSTLVSFSITIHKISNQTYR